MGIENRSYPVDRITGMSIGRTDLMFWSAGGDEIEVASLLRQGANVNATDGDGDSALYYAASKRQLRVVEMLVRHGADVNVAGSSGSPLHVAALQNWVTGLSLLINAGASLDAGYPSASGVRHITAMMLAAGAGSDESVEELQRNGAKVNAFDSDGDSALFYAASRGRVSTVNMLVSLGADVSPEPNTSGYTPLGIAAATATPIVACPPGSTIREFRDIVAALLRAGANPSPMYSKGYVLYRPTSQGLEHAALGRVSELALVGDWSVAWVPVDQRREFPGDPFGLVSSFNPIVAREMPSTSASAIMPRSGEHDDGADRPETDVEILGSNETGFLNRPTVIVLWNGMEIGRVAHGGRFNFSIREDGEVTFRYLFRTAKLLIRASGSVKIQLSWDRTWGKLVAQQVDGPSDIRSS